jgi:hypothetical protein
MYLALPLTLLLVLGHGAPSNSYLFPRASSAINSGLARAHRFALRNSAGLARDLRVAFKSVLVAQPNGDARQVYCTSPRSNNTGFPAGGTSTARPTGTSSASTPGATVSPSPWTLAEAHVSSFPYCSGRADPPR